MESKLNILIISYSYDPALTPRAIRWTTLYNQFLSRGHNVQVISSNSSLQERALPNKDIHYVGMSFKKLTQSAKNTLNSENTPQLSSIFLLLKKSIYKLLSKTHALIIKPFRWPDFAWPFIFFGFMRARKLTKRNKYDLIVTVSHPFSCHIIGVFIKYLNPDLKWIADNGDPFALMEKPQVNNFFLYKRLNLFVESKVVDMCDYFAVTTHNTKKLYESSLRFDAKKIKVIGPLLSNQALRAFENKVNPNIRNEVLKFNFFGTLYSTIRNPSYLINVLELLSNRLQETIEINFYGETNDFVYKSICKDNFRVTFHGVLGREEVLEKINTSGILLNIGNANKYQLPSKLVEYIASGNPIINFASIPEDSSSLFLSEFHETLSIFQNEGTENEHAQSIYDFIINIKKLGKTLPRSVDAFSPSYISKKYLEL